MKRATQADVAAIAAFLAQRPERAMFPLSNLERFGLDGDHDYAPRMWIHRERGDVSAVLTVTSNGAVMPNCTPEDAAEVLKGHDVLGVVGPTELCRPLIEWLELNKGDIELDKDEPQFSLSLNDLRIPDGPGELRPLQEADPEQMISWRTAYCRETLGRDQKAAAESGRKDYASYVTAGSHRVLMEGNVALATTGFNARLPRIVQIGGVYTPPDRRGRGLARRAVALHLDEARRAGVTQATLFASGPAAQRAYQAIGFVKTGSWTLMMRAKPMRVGTAA